jgi:hypothetical protein
MGTIVEQCVPPLAAGDRLTRAKFLRRWEGYLNEVTLDEMTAEPCRGYKPASTR